MSRCKEILYDHFNPGSAVLLCDLDFRHSEDYHEDSLRRVRWIKIEDEAPAMVPALPVPPLRVVGVENDDGNDSRSDELLAAASSSGQADPGKNRSRWRLARKQPLGV